MQKTVPWKKPIALVGRRHKLNLLEASQLEREEERERERERERESE